MNIAIIGVGNVGGALTKAWAPKGHRLFLGVQDLGKPELAQYLGDTVTAHSVPDAAQAAEIIVLALPPAALQEVCSAMGDIKAKVIIDCANTMFQKIEGFDSTTQAVQTWTGGANVVKAFNTAGANIIGNTDFGGTVADTYMAGGDDAAKKIIDRLARDAGFARAVDCGPVENAKLLEGLAAVWVGLAQNSALGREFSFKMLHR